jgi:tetratricopeptide (TPR) repeat protein
VKAAALVVLIAIAAPALALDVKATIDPPRVAAGESADLAVTIDGAQNAPTPQVGNAGGLTVSYTGPASQVSIVNGRMTASVTHHFSVVGTKPGRYTLGPITGDVDGKRYDAGSVALEVTAASTAEAPGGGQDDQLTLELSAPRTEVYLHERLPVSVKLAVGAVRLSDLQYPVLAGDGVALEKFPEPAQRRENTSRGVMQVVDFQTTLTPLKAGRVTVGPATMSMSLIVVGRHNRGFFSGFFDSESRPLQLQSKPLVLNVLPLPTEGRPAGFGNAVGKFSFEVSAQPTDVAAGDPVTVKSVVRGDGSLDGLAPPALVPNDGLRVYPPQAGQAAGSANERSFEQVVIPLREGPTALAVPRFSYFDPTARAYRTIAPPPIPLIVRPSAQAKATPEIVGGTPAPLAPAARPETLAKDIVFIKDAPGTLRPVGERRWRTPWWWMVQLLPVGLWLGASSYARQRNRLAGDVRYARFTRAGRETRTALARARDALAQARVGEAHDLVAAAVRDYLAAKLDLPPGAVPDSAPARVRASGDGPVADEVAAFFAGCEAVRFAPSGASPHEVEAALERADAIVGALERNRRLGRGALAVLALMALAATALAAGEGPSALFFRANGLYGTEQYAAAAAAYEQALADGVESGPLHFNLGNAYYKTGDVGHAVLAYERARRLMPGDPDLRANLAFARDQAKDVATESPLPALAFPLAGRVSTDTLCAVVAGVWWTAWGLLVLGVLVPAADRVARGAAVVAGIAGVLVASSAAYEWWTVDHPTFAVVVVRSDATVRSEPTPSATALFVATPGTVLRVERTRDTSSLVTSRDGRRGWVESATLATI